MRAFFTFSRTRSTEGYGQSTSTLAAPVISARSNDEFPRKHQPRITVLKNFGKLLKVIEITPELEQAAWRDVEGYSDKDFSFTDCISCVVLQLFELT